MLNDIMLLSDTFFFVLFLKDEGPQIIMSLSLFHVYDVVCCHISKAAPFDHE